MNLKSMIHTVSTLALCGFVSLSTAVAGTYTVTGTLRYFDGRTTGNKPLGQFNGAGNVKFEIYDADPGDWFGDDFLTSGITSTNGTFSKTFTFDQWDDPNADLYIKFIYENSKWKVHMGDLFGTPYSVRSTTRTNASFGTVAFGNINIASGSLQESAMWVFQSMNEGWNLIEGINGFNTGGQASVQWPGKAECPTSCWDGFTLHITSNRASSGFNVVHEFGHYNHQRAWNGNLPSGDYCRTEGSGSTNCGHSWNSREWSYTAFVEAWAEFTALAALGFAGTNNNNVDLNYSDIEDRNTNTMGSGNEGNVAAALCDILDNRIDSHTGNGFSGSDTISWNFAGMISVLQHMTSSEVNDQPTIRDYVDEIREMFTNISGTTWQSLLNNNWISYTP